MAQKRVGANFGIRYSEAFKMAVVQELEENDLPFACVRKKYGIKSDATVATWTRKYGNGTRGKVVRVEKPEEIARCTFQSPGSPPGAPALCFPNAFLIHIRP